jgi:hypothetical protein
MLVGPAVTIAQHPGRVARSRRRPGIVIRVISGRPLDVPLGAPVQMRPPPLTSGSPGDQAGRGSYPGEHRGMFQRIGSREAAPVIDVLRNVAQDRDTRQRAMTIEVTGSHAVIITAEQLCYRSPR